jgi:hypothetical protein
LRVPINPAIRSRLLNIGNRPDATDALAGNVKVRMVSALRPAFVAAAVAWALLLPLAPWVASRPHASTEGAAFVIAVYGIGSLICHQLPERSYHVWAAQMPVCARCVGIYFGAAAASVVAAFRTAEVVRHTTPVAQGPSPRKASLTQRSARTALVIAVLPTLLTLAYEWTTGHMPAHWIRAAAGVPIGGAAAWLVVAAADNQVN